MTDEKEKQAQPATLQPDFNERAVIRKLSFVSVIVNTVLSGFKLFAGITGKSSAMISDAVHSFSDVLTTLIAWIGVRISQKASDFAHPYGHERLECIAALILGAVLMVTGLGIGRTGIVNILLKDDKTLAVPGAIAMIAAAVSIVGKEALYRYTRYYAKLIRSSAFMADAWHHRSDAFSSIGSLVGIAGAMLGFPALDSAASVVICLFIIKVSWDIQKDAVVKLLDTSCGEAYERMLSEYVSAQDGVVYVDLLRSRMFGSRVYIDLEIQVDGDKSLRDAHEIAEQIHTLVEHKFPDVKHIMIHVNPADETGG